MVLTMWFEWTLEVPHHASDAVANFLIERGAPGLQIEPRAGQVLLTAYFAAAPPVTALRRFCADIGCPEVADHSCVRPIASEDWAENWKVHFEPRLVGERLYVCPPWKPAAPEGRLPIVIDPGMAFGTGHHATTRGCLELLEDGLRESGVRRALDLGTGSGILAIALAKLGVAEIWAVDTDPHACRIAAANAQLNHVERHIHFAPHLENVAGPFDLIVANLFANVLTELARPLTAALRSPGTLICSGLLSTDEAMVRGAYEGRGLSLATRRDDPPWVTLAWHLKERP